jgi:uncharacterized protein YdeI (YjbR/CyaY-like superfamily)
VRHTWTGLNVSHEGVEVSTFQSPQEFRRWLEEHHGTSKELTVRCYKTRVKQKGLTYRQALDEALCFGWIDGVRRALDQESFSTRFTPRRPGSKWSAVNVRRAAELQSSGRMRAAGRTAFAARSAEHSRHYSYETRCTPLDRSSLARLKANKRAWNFFQAQPPWYQRTSSFWVMDAKRAATREKRLSELIAKSAEGEPIKPLDRRSPGKGLE